MAKPMTLQQLVGYLRTWSSYNFFKKQNPQAPDPVEAFGTDLLQAYGTTDVNYTITVSFPIFLFLARRPLHAIDSHNKQVHM